MIEWRKSSRSGGLNDDACVELAALAGEVWVRDSKDPDGGWLELDRVTFARLLGRVKCTELGRE
nr:DUF397 domain-containing protein [Actinomadura rugatobispora]